MPSVIESATTYAFRRYILIGPPLAQHLGMGQCCANVVIYIYAIVGSTWDQHGVYATTCCSNVVLAIACLIVVPTLKQFQYLPYVTCSMLFQHTQKSIIINSMLHLHEKFWHSTTRNNAKNKDD